MKQSFLAKIRDAAMELIGTVKVDNLTIPVRAFNDNDTDKDDIAIIVNCFDSQPAHEENPNLPDRKCKLDIAISSLAVEDTDTATADSILAEVHSLVHGTITAAALAQKSGLTVDAVILGNDSSALTGEEFVMVFSSVVYVQDALINNTENEV